VITLACSAPPETGGLGRHFAELLDDARSGGGPYRYYSAALDRADPDTGEVVSTRAAERFCRLTPLRFSAGWRTFVGGDAFDRSVASRLVSTDVHVGFPAQSRRTFARARQLGARRLQLAAASSHVDHVASRHADAQRRWPIEGDWLSDRYRRKALEEYEIADVIQVTSYYSRQTFLERGIPASKLQMWSPSTHPRFRPGARPEDGLFRVVYVGALSVVKGTPVLVEALQRLRQANLELTLVGGYGTRGMRRYLEEAMARDPRIRIAAGDPLPHLQRADVLVHPSYQDGFAYAPVEALACGVPVIVSEDTGMKEHVQSGQNGWVVPTGSSESIADLVEALMARPLRGSPGHVAVSEPAHPG
jgi:glycosyltransferase involved in cell wall biosynthesis